MSEASATAAYYYSVFDFPYLTSLKKGHKHLLAEFEELTGGDMTVSMAEYTFVTADGATVTRHIPGTTKYAPVTLLHAINVQGQALYIWYLAVSEGKLKKARNSLSIAMIDRETKKPMVIWHLDNAIPTQISGFSFNSKTAEYYTSLELTIQAERISMHYL
jgi:phage tail-like protein